MSEASVLMCTHSFERLPQLRHGVDSVLGGNVLPKEFFVIVDRNPELREALRLELPREVQVIDSAGIGASGARNTGLHLATAEVIACIDDDAWAEPAWLEEMLKPFEDPAVVGAGGRVVPDWEDDASTLPEELYWVVGSTYKGHRKDAGPITRPIGASMAGRRTAMLDVGGFAAEFGPGSALAFNEELVLYTNLSRVFGDDSILFVPTAVVHHYAPRSRTTWSYLRHRSAVEGRSKAHVRAMFGASVMADDRGYVLRHLAPTILRHLAGGMLRRERGTLIAGAKLGTSFAVTAGNYLSHRILHLLPLRRPRPSAERGGRRVGMAGARRADLQRPVPRSTSQ